MEQTAQIVVWEAQKWSSMEYLRLEEREGQIVADGTIVMVEDHLPQRIVYAIRCAAAWTVRQVSMQVESTTGARLQLHSDGAGQWTNDQGQRLAALVGCIDVDIAATPFTNTLPIRRLALKPGESAEIKVAYITIPELSFSTAMQRYTCLEAHAQGGRYRYESLSSGFTAEITVDAAGLVVDYAELWKRLWPR